MSFDYTLRRIACIGAADVRFTLFSLKQCVDLLVPCDSMCWRVRVGVGLLAFKTTLETATASLSNRFEIVCEWGITNDGSRRPERSEHVVVVSRGFLFSLRELKSMALTRLLPAV
jgi:hypothetical protein